MTQFQVTSHSHSHQASVAGGPPLPRRRVHRPHHRASTRVTPARVLVACGRRRLILGPLLATGPTGILWCWRQGRSAPPPKGFVLVMRKLLRPPHCVWTLSCAMTLRAALASALPVRCRRCCRCQRAAVATAPLPSAHSRCRSRRCCCRCVRASLRRQATLKSWLPCTNKPTCT